MSGVETCPDCRDTGIISRPYIAGVVSTMTACTCDAGRQFAADIAAQRARVAELEAATDQLQYIASANATRAEKADTDLIRRGDAMDLRDELADVIGARPLSSIHSALSEYRKAIRALPAHPAQEPPSSGVTAGATGAGQVAWPGPGRFTDLPRKLRRAAQLVFADDLTEGWRQWISDTAEDAALKIEALERDLASTCAKNAQVAPAPVVPADQRAAIEALADRMWRVHPKDIHAAGYEHLERGGKYENPRAAWYADQIEALFKQFRDQVSPVEPAEGLDPERLVMAWMSEMEGFATRGERFMDTITDGNDVAPWLHAACQVGIDAALRTAPPVGARVKSLMWEEVDFCGQPAAFAETEFGAWMVVAYRGRSGRWAHTDPAGNDSGDDWETRFEAQAAAQADYEARILAALLPAGEGE